MNNPEYREATHADLVPDARVYAYYEGPEPTRETLGYVDSLAADGWARVVLDDGRKVYADAQRLAVLR